MFLRTVVFSPRREPSQTFLAFGQSERTRNPLLHCTPTKIGFTMFNFVAKLMKINYQIVRRQNHMSMKTILARTSLVFASTALLLASGFGANAATPSSLLDSGNIAKPAKICGYPDNPDRSCEWWANTDTCYQIGQSNAPQWQKLACFYAGFSRK